MAPFFSCSRISEKLKGSYIAAINSVLRSHYWHVLILNLQCLRAQEYQISHYPSPHAWGQTELPFTDRKIRAKEIKIIPEPHCPSGKEPRMGQILCLQEENKYP